MDPSPIPLNLGIVAHVDAGKTSLTERLLHDAGATTTLGSVNAGTTTTDSMELERRRGITIRASVASFMLDAQPVNLLDTPGHPDFIAEVERSLTVLDGAVLVLSAVEGVQPQSVLIWRALRRMGVPALIFINKLDRHGADPDAVLAQVRRRLTPITPLLTAPSGIGTAGASVAPIDWTDPVVIGAAAETDEQLLARWVDGGSISPSRVKRSLRTAIAAGRATAVCTGSALTGAGMTELRTALSTLIPRPRPVEGPPAGTVFALDHTDQGRRLWVRLWSGQLAPRKQLTVGDRRPRRITSVEVSSAHGTPHVARTGDIVAIRGIDAQIGDQFGPVPDRPRPDLPPPVLHVLIEPEDPTQRGSLFAGLASLADEDPLIGLHLDESVGQAGLTLHGEVQKEVIAARLADEFGIRARFGDSSVRCIERLQGVGVARDEMGLNANPYVAGLELTVEPRPIGHGVSFDPGIEPGRLTRAFVVATEQTTRQTLEQGLAGWPVTDCHVAMTWSQFDAPSTVAADFRGITPVVLMAALQAAGTTVCEPIEELSIDLPPDLLGAVIEALGRIGGVVRSAEPPANPAAGADATVVAWLATRLVPRFTAGLPDLTGGEAVLSRRPDHYSPARAPIPRRPRTGWDPLDRVTWFRQVTR